MKSNIEYLSKYLRDEKFDEGKKLLEQGVSPQYIVGNVDFYGNIINVDERVLIPRFETELLVEKTCNYILEKFKDEVNILDIGTGSGCISITLSKKLNCKVTACDVSSDALDCAQENAKLNGVSIDFILSDVFSNVNGRFDVIISNPPYIDVEEEIEDIVRNNEPHLALFAPNKGLYFYDKILSECSKYLKDKFLIAFEIGYKQADSILEIAHKYLKDVNCCVEKDYSGKDRFVFIYK